MAFNILYSDGVDQQSFFTYLDQVAETVGCGPFDINPTKCLGVLSSIRQDFPHIDGLEKASPFKKVANFVVWFVSERPVLSTMPESIIGGRLAGINNHQNAIIAFNLAIDSLHGATLHRGDGEVIRLKNRITLSAHSYGDIIEALSALSPSVHYQLVTVLFEQMAYRANPEAAYPAVI